MIYLLVGYVLLLVIPLFISSWRIAIWAFAAESLVTGFILIRTEGFDSWSTRIQVLDLILFRSLIVPICLAGILKKIQGSRGFDTIPANFVVWTLVLGLLFASYWFGQAVFPSEFQSAIHFGTASAGAMMGLFILSNQSSSMGQIVGLLTLEAGTMLMEVLAAHQERWIIQLGLKVVFLWSIALICTFVQRFSELKVAPPESSWPLHHEEREVL